MILIAAPKHVIILPEKEEEQTASGIFIQDSSKGKFKSAKGKLIQISKDCITDQQFIGCEVRFKPFAKEEVEINGEVYWVIPEADLIAFITEKWSHDKA